MSTLSSKNGPAQDHPLTSEAQLLEPFRAGEKPRERFGVGIEYERLPVLRDSGLAAPYAGEGPSVERLMRTLVERCGWEPEFENGHIIALDRDGTRMTLEPGAQIELSGRVHTCLNTAHDELCGFIREADEIADRTGIALIGIGMHPFTDFREIAQVPKNRYKIMAPYLAGQGHLAHGMMRATAGCQMNLDYSSEREAMEMIRVAMGISPLVTAMCAHSPLSLGQANGFMTKRSHIWLHTDPDRCGLLEWSLRDDTTYSDYAAYALDVPMMFVVRDNKWLDMTGRTFREFMKGDTRGLVPMKSDWDLHLTTLFPEVRLKSYVEVRGADSGPPEITLAIAALWKGILYDPSARAGAGDLVKGATFPALQAFYRDAARRGLRAVLGGTPATELAGELLRIAAAGLPEKERHRLDPLRVLAIEEKRTLADKLLENWAGEWERNPARLVEALRAASATLCP